MKLTSDEFFSRRRLSWAPDCKATTPRPGSARGACTPRHSVSPCCREGSHGLTSSFGSEPSLPSPGSSADLSRSRAPSLSGAGQTYGRVKVIYDILLVLLLPELVGTSGYHLSIASCIPYVKGEHGLEGVQALLLLTGWLSSLMWKDVPWSEHMTRRVARLLPPYLVAVALTGAVVAITCNYGACWAQLLLEAGTLGGWNPLILWLSQNRPLWFVSTVMTYHYLSPFYLRWLRHRSAPGLALLFLGLCALRSCTAVTALLAFPTVVSPQVIRVWAPVQVWLPLLGAVLHQLGERCAGDMPASMNIQALWLAAGCLVLIWMAHDSTTLLGVVASLIPGVDVEVVQSLVTETNLKTGVSFPIAVFLMHCVDGTFGAIERLRGLRGVRSVCSIVGFVLNISFTLYLTHWPLVVLLQSFGLVAGSWRGLLGLWIVSILFASIVETLVMQPVALHCNAWLWDKVCSVREFSKESVLGSVVYEPSHLTNTNLYMASSSLCLMTQDEWLRDQRQQAIDAEFQAIPRLHTFHSISKAKSVVLRAHQ